MMLLKPENFCVQMVSKEWIHTISYNIGPLGILTLFMLSISLIMASTSDYQWGCQ